MDTAAANTHAILDRLGRPHRVALLTDAQAMSDFQAAAMLTIGIYGIRYIEGAEVNRAEDIIAGTRAALAVMASWPALLAA